MIEAWNYFHQKFVNVTLKSKEKCLIDGYPLNFTMEEDRKIKSEKNDNESGKSDVNVISNLAVNAYQPYITFDKFRFVPTPSISLYHGSIINSSSSPRNTNPSISLPSLGAKSTSPTYFSPTTTSAVMGGRSICSLVHNEVTVNPPPSSVTYDREFWIEDVKFDFQL
jgi:hypothetical protein